LNPATRWPLIDAVKGVACVLIVWHHMTIYGPMGEGAHALAPALFDWLAAYGRLAVQVFLVVGGFLAASSLAPGGAAPTQPAWRRIARRYARLAMPYLAAVGLTVLAAAWVRPWLGNELVPAAPTLLQLVAHALLLQDLLGYDALSAGVWYVAIDFQLFALALLLLGAQRLAGALVLMVAVASLFFFNRDAGLDTTALYFFGAYGLGMSSWWIGRAERTGVWSLGIVVLAAIGAAALWFDWRSRIAIALVTALCLALAERHGARIAGRWSSVVEAPLLALGRISYSLFLIHFAVILLVGALFSRWGAVQPWVDVLGMLATFALSVVAAILLHRWVEARRASWRAVLVLFGALLACGGVAALR
jgi:peptidoglycan/LPS O-acetylase OafA/YrhL